MQLKTKNQYEELFVNPKMLYFINMIRETKEMHAYSRTVKLIICAKGEQ